MFQLKPLKSIVVEELPPPGGGPPVVGGGGGAVKLTIILISYQNNFSINMIFMHDLSRLSVPGQVFSVTTDVRILCCV